MSGYVKQYRALNKELAQLERNLEPDKWKLAEIAHSAVTEGGFTRKAFAEAVGVSAATVARQVTIWTKYGGQKTMPSYLEATIELAGAPNFDGKGRTDAPSPAQVAELLAKPEYARVAVRNAKAMGVVAREQEADYRQRHPGTPNEDPARAGRRAGENMGRNLGLRGDRATEELNLAARIILDAKRYCDEFGIEDGEAEQHAIAHVKRALRLYETQSDLTESDHEWADQIGVRI
jgi:hypothetical protein